MPSTPVQTINYLNKKQRPLLLYVLLEQWDMKCHWCRRQLRDSTDAEIDHILPQSSDQQTLVDFGRPADFDLNAVENLAPICAAGPRCNQTKSDAVNRVAGAIMVSLNSAENKANAIVAQINRIGNARGLEKNLVSAVTAQLNERTGKLYEKYGESLAQRLAQVSINAVEGYRNTVYLEPDVDWAYLPEPDQLLIMGAADPTQIPLLLDKDMRFAFRVAQEIFGLDPAIYIQEALTEIINDADGEVGKYVDATWDNAAVSIAENWQVTVESMTENHSEDLDLEIHISGRIECSYAGHRIAGSMMNDRQVVVNVLIPFNISCIKSRDAQQFTVDHNGVPEFDYYYD